MELFSEYFKKDHILSKIDARIKIIVTMTILAMVLSYRGFVLPLSVAAACLLLCINMKIPVRVLMLRFAEPAFIMVIILILKIFFSGKDVLFFISFSIPHLSFLTLTGYKDGLIEGLMIASRIFAAVSVVALMGFSTPFTEFIAGLSWLRVPKGFIEILMFAYRYIFVLLEDAMVIYNAQKNRLGYSTIKRGLGSFGILAGSLLLKAFEHSHNITVSMMQRGYDGNMPMMKQKHFKTLEVVISALLIIVIGLVWTT